MLELANIFQSNMILQRKKPIYVWGETTAHHLVEIELKEKRYVVKADEEGKWSAKLDSFEADNNVSMEIVSGQEKIVLSNIAIGEVWVAGGQSNMEFPMRYEKHMEEERQTCDNSSIRFFDVPEIAFDGQNTDFDYSKVGIWREANSKDLEYFSAVGYYFQKKLFQELNVPIGIVGCNWGGTYSAAWMSSKSVNRTGKPWIEFYESQMKEVDKEEYWEVQHHSAMNSRGDLFADPFNELVLPRTPSMEEINDFFSNMQDQNNHAINLVKPQMAPGCLYERMVRTIAPYTVRGVLWYQGESDDMLKQQHLYEDMLQAVIIDWRSIWKDETLPFLVVQLPGWEHWIWAGADNFPILRACQERVTDKDPNAYLCSISDAGERNDIHPKDKTKVGHRLALLALNHIYQKQIISDAPKLEKVHLIENIMTLSFINTGDGLYVKGNKIEALDILVDDISIEFEYQIKKNQLIIILPYPCRKTVKINFAQENWYCVNLYNSSDIPAIPFTGYCEADMI